MEVINGFILWYSRYSGWALVDPNGETIETFGESQPDNQQIQSIIAAWEFTGCLA